MCSTFSSLCLDRWPSTSPGPPPWPLEPSLMLRMPTPRGAGPPTALSPGGAAHLIPHPCTTRRQKCRRRSEGSSFNSTPPTRECHEHCSTVAQSAPASAVPLLVRTRYRSVPCRSTAPRCCTVLYQPRPHRSSTCRTNITCGGLICVSSRVSTRCGFELKSSRATLEAHAQAARGVWSELFCWSFSRTFHMF
jgi:hypothetical protein